MTAPYRTAGDVRARTGTLPRLTFDTGTLRLVRVTADAFVIERRLSTDHTDAMGVITNTFAWHADQTIRRFTSEDRKMYEPLGGLAGLGMDTKGREQEDRLFQLLDAWDLIINGVLP